MQTKVKNKPTTLRCFVRFNGQRSPFSTDVKVEPRYFDKAKGRAIVTARFDGGDINARLEQIEEFVKDRFGEMVDFPDPALFKQICEAFVMSGRNTVTEKDDDTTPLTFIAYIERLAADSRSGNRKILSGPRKGQPYKLDSIKAYDSVAYNLKKFAKHEKVVDFPFRSVDEKFYTRFSDFFYNELKLSVGYFSTAIKTIKTAMNEAKAAGLHSFSGHNSRGFIKPQYESDTVSLNLEIRG